MDNMTTVPRRRALTRADLDALPDDGWRHELVDGSLVMTPAPSRRHQTAVVRLLVQLDRSCPADLQVLVAPFDVALGPDTVVEPDLLVARRSDLTDRDLPTAPLLAVEVLSPSTRHIDLGLKLRRYETAGCPSYWVVDPGTDTTPATLVAWELRDGAYVEAAQVTGDRAVDLALPFPVRVVPDALRV
jgi:Uma2 family endonuclease